jgi:hypothetical protein
MDLYNKKMKVSKSKYILVFAAVFLCLVMAGTATATDGTTFPVDDAGIAAYVKVSESIELAKVVLVCDSIVEMNETYFIGVVRNHDGYNTFLYVGADGWVIPYYDKNSVASPIVRWNMLSDYDPTIETVTAMNTLEEVISRVCTNLEINYDTIKSEIKYYDFKYPDATHMVIIYDIAHGETENSFELLIPSDFVTVYESSWSFYTDYKASLNRNGGCLCTCPSPGSWNEAICLGSTNLNCNTPYQIEVRNQETGSEYTSGVGWVFVYRK